MEEEIKKKLEEFNESNLANMALTFTAEGISKNLRSILHKKIVFITKMMEYSSNLSDSLSHTDKKVVQEVFFNPESLIFKFYDHLYQEMKLVNTTLNHTIYQLVSQESLLKDGILKDSDNLNEEENSK